MAGAVAMVQPSLRLRSLTKVVEDPSCWEGVTEFGDAFYAQFEGGVLSWGYGASPGEARGAACDAPKRRCGGSRACDMETSRLLELLGLAVVG